MTVPQLLSLPFEDIEKISDEELDKYLSPFFPQTRPKNTDALKDLLEGDPDIAKMMAERKAEKDQKKRTLKL